MRFRLAFASKALASIDYAKENLTNFDLYKITEEKRPGYSLLFVEFNTLEELLWFIRFEGRVILDEDTLRVYDDSVE